MGNVIGTALSLALLATLAACGGTNTGGNDVAASASTASDSSDISSEAAEITFGDESEFIAKMATDMTLSKKLGMSTGKIIQFNDYNVYSIDKSSWEKGGSLSLLNDYSLGTETKIECLLSASEGDAFLKDSSRRHVSLKGRIQSFSSASGLTINPCIATTK